MRHHGGEGTREGCLIIADITGYTAFLSQSELDHAQDSLRTLLEVILEKARPPLVLSKLEGDAVFTYAPSEAVIQGQSLVEALEGIYISFARALERMVLNTNCTCNACRNIPKLDLKFFVHYGTFVVQQITDRAELLGNDVVLLHRLAKNDITEKTGLRAYAAYTQAAVTALQLGEFAAGLPMHKEAYEYFGDVTLYVQDMHVVWEQERARVRYGISNVEAKIRYEMDFPVPPEVFWGYITDAYYRNMLMGADSHKVEGRKQGRIGPGTVYQCAHGKTLIDQTVVEWRPFEEYTYDTVLPILKGVLYRFTFRLTPTPEGTHFSALGAPSHGSALGKLVANVVLRIPPTFGANLRRFRQQVEADMTERMQSLPAHSGVSTTDVATEVRTALAENTQPPSIHLPP